MEEYKGLTVKENAKGKAGQALTNNFKHVADKIEEIDIESDNLESQLEIIEGDINTLSSRVDLVEENLISTPTTFYCATDGDDLTGDGSEQSPWYSLTQAMDYLRTKRLSTTVIIQVKDGHYDTANVDLSHADGGYISVIGETDGSTELTGNTSYISGEEYARVYDINVANNHGAVVGDFISIYEPSGGTNGESLAGYHEITAVNGNTLRILAKSQGNNTASGAVESEVIIHRSIIKSSMSITNSRLSKISNLGFVTLSLYRSTLDSIDKVGLMNLQNIDNSNIDLWQRGGILRRFTSITDSNANIFKVGFSRDQSGGAISLNQSHIIMRYCTVSSTTSMTATCLEMHDSYCNGVSPRWNSSLLCIDSEIVGETTGISVQENSTLYVIRSVISNATFNIYAYDGAIFVIRECTIKDGTNGLYLRRAANGLLNSVTFTNVTTEINSDATCITHQW